MIQAPNWPAVETMLYELGKEAIERFVREHPDTPCSFFAYTANPIAGIFATCFDTPQNALQQAQKIEEEARQKREKKLHSPTAWMYAHSRLEKPGVIDFAREIDFFHYPLYTRLDFAEWTAFFDSESYPQRQPGQDDYLAGNTRVIIWKVLERLIADDVFLRIRTTSLFRLGYQLFEEDLVVLRILNWPDLSAMGEQASSC